MSGCILPEQGAEKHCLVLPAVRDRLKVFVGLTQDLSSHGSHQLHRERLTTLKERFFS